MNYKKLKIFLKLIILQIIFLGVTNIVKASENTDISILFKVVSESNYSIEYKKWLVLSNEERKNYIIPTIYNIDLNTDLLEDEAGESVLPEKYSLKDKLNLNVRNQENTNFCWAFAASKVFETTYANLNNKVTINELSPRHMAYATSRYFNNNIENPNGFNRNVDVGGNYFQATAYWANGSGPILEKDMPFVNSMEKINISEIQNKSVQAQLEDATFFPNIYKSYNGLEKINYYNGNGIEYTKDDIETFRNMIKNQIIKYGAVGSMTYISTSQDMNYFSSVENNCYYCDNPNLLVNHAITIIGWDDNFSRDNFDGKSKPVNDGAYLVLNSYGKTWGSNEGCYYISYDDYFIENSMFGIQGVSDKDYDNIYQYDELGMSSYITNTLIPTSIYGANVFSKKTSENEKLSEIGIYVYNKSDIEVYVNANGKSLDINNLSKVYIADSLSSGYHIIKLDKPVTVGETFSIVVKYSNNALATLPIESKVNGIDFYDTAMANKEESFFSPNGIEWADITDIDGANTANACIKAFTINSTQNASETDYIANKNWKLINGNNITMLSGINEKTTIDELLSATNYKSGYTIKAYKNGSQVTIGNVTTGTVIKICEGSNVIQEYTVIIYGDTTGDGNIQSSDALAIIKNALNIVSFKNEVYLEAGRVTFSKRNGAKDPNAVDALACIKHKLGLSIISQY